MYTEDTIVAIATANGIGSISIVRLSGVDSLKIAKKITQGTVLQPRMAKLSKIYDTKDELIDEALLIYFKNPHSFTGEDIVEFQCHGGIAITNIVLATCIDAGARIANPGEFSKRAFLNGKIDLSQAQAISKMIEARSEDAVKLLARQLKGELKDFVDDIRKDLLFMLAYTEVNIDYAEEDLPEDLVKQIEAKLSELKKSLKSTLSASKAREGLMQGFKVAIVGKPNVGKSSLLNSLLNYNRAIVSDIAGTTRDTIEEQVKIGTHLIRIVDTAGIREANDEIERIGIERSLEAIQESDIVVALFDSSRELDAEDEQILSLIKKHAKNKHLIYVKNKIDLEEKFVVKEMKFDLELNSKESVISLVEALKGIMDKSNSSDEIMLISQRQIMAVENTLQNIIDALEPLKDQELEIFSFHLNEAVKEIASITRPFENDEMLDKMFGSFCLGK